jgi:two-component system chemotaxis response regulator CheB
MSQVKVVRHWRSMHTPSKATPSRKRPASGSSVPGKVVAIATSTGGPAALYRLFSDLPGDFPAPILVVQHITRGFVAGLVDWLNKAAGVRVKLAERGEPLKPSTGYLAPDDFHLGVTAQGEVVLAADPPVGGFRPSGTYLFESAARAYGAAAVAVILTGMGEDGVEGLRAVRQAGGRILAQDEASSVIFGMPGAAVAAGLADQVLPLADIPSRLMEVVNYGSR